jgi:hypothetical protein
MPSSLTSGPDGGPRTWRVSRDSALALSDLAKFLSCASPRENRHECTDSRFGREPVKRVLEALLNYLRFEEAAVFRTNALVLAFEPATGGPVQSAQ